MDWRTVRFDWNRARAFLVTAEEGSLSAAARALGMAQPTLSRQVDALEQELDVLLFDRVGRRLVLTEAGLDLLEHARTMGEAANRLSLAASGASQNLEGSVVITASDVFSAHLLPPVLAELRRTHPGIDVELVATNDARDLLRREADIALRNFRPSHPDLVAKKLGDMGGRLYATPSCLDAIGRPAAPADFAGADFIGFDRTEAFIDHLRPLGFELSQRNFPFVCENLLVSWSFVKEGLGIGVMSDVVGDADPDVERACPDLAPMVFPVWLVSHRELHTSRRVRVVFDLLAERIAAACA